MNCSCFMEHPQTKQGEQLQRKDLTWESQTSKECMVQVLTLLTAHANQISTQEVVRSGLSWYVESWWGVLSSHKKRTMTLLVPQEDLLKIQMADHTIRSLLNRVSPIMDLSCSALRRSENDTSLCREKTRIPLRVDSCNTEVIDRRDRRKKRDNLLFQHTL